MAFLLVCGAATVVQPSIGSRYELYNAELLFIYGMLALSLNFAMHVNLLSVGQPAIFAVGAYSVAILHTDRGWPFFGALLVGVLLGVVVGALIGAPALRLGLFTFAMVTLGYTFAAQQLLFQWADLTGGGNGIGGIRAPAPFDDLESYYWLVLIGLALSWLLSRNLFRSPFGRAARAVHDQPSAASARGINTFRVKLRSFCVGSGLAALAGGLFAPLLGFVSPDAFDVDLALLLVLMLLIGGPGTLLGPLVGAVLLFRLPIVVENLTSTPGEWSALAYGVALLLVVRFLPAGIVPTARAVTSWARHRLTGRSEEDQAGASSSLDLALLLAELGISAPSRAPSRGEVPLLSVTGVSKSFGAVTALSDVDLELRPGEVHGLLGANGSGKTTLLNAISGYLEPDSGDIRHAGSSLLGLSVNQRAQRGISRSFQTPLLFDGMSLLDNVLVALDGGRPMTWRQRLSGSRARALENRGVAQAQRLLQAMGLDERADQAPGSLTPRERRLLELCQVLASRPQVVLLDEPAGGLVEAELQEIRALVERLRDAGAAVLLIEHHAELVLEASDRVTVLSSGRVIACGRPEEVRSDPQVIESYLGSGFEISLRSRGLGSASAGDEGTVS